MNFVQGYPPAKPEGGKSANAHGMSAQELQTTRLGKRARFNVQRKTIMNKATITS